MNEKLTVCEKCIYCGICSSMDVEGHMFDVKEIGDCSNFASRDPIQEAYDILLKIRDTGDYTLIDDAITYLSEVLA